MDLNLRNKTVLITGASSGIGAAAALLFSQEGANVVIGYRNNESAAQQILDQVKSNGVQAWLCQMDVTRAAAVRDVVGRVGSKLSGLDGVVLCAGENRITAMADISPEEWSEVIATNLNGAFFVLQAAMPLLNDGAGVVIVASVAAHTGAPRHAHYAAAKAGLVNLAKSAARELAPRVRVNCVCPGVTLTPMGRATMERADEDYARKKLLLQRFAEPEEIARWIVFVASPANTFMTGATIDVNGGRTP
ncbi:MAG TPA: SDR family NAD(P)-dependent oxidoreductase [Candidatus Limnocylindrales bacterium]|nr:SDR family NAD(P)-dependent oxidoreductase [Candidatus Limnocylindrales bacterium]